MYIIFNRMLIVFEDEYEYRVWKMLVVDLGSGKEFFLFLEILLVVSFYCRSVV